MNHEEPAESSLTQISHFAREEPLRDTDGIEHRPQDVETCHEHHPAQPSRMDRHEETIDAEVVDSWDYSTQS